MAGRKGMKSEFRIYWKTRTPCLSPGDTGRQHQTGQIHIQKQTLARSKPGNLEHGTRKNEKNNRSEFGNMARQGNEEIKYTS